MSKRLRIENEAQEELEAASAWYEERRAGLGREFLSCVRDTYDRIERDPKAWARVPEIEDYLERTLSTLAVEGVRRCLVRRFPYAVVYVELTTEIRIVAVAHTSREPGYWKSR
jgi:hypothetical protein